MTIPIITTGPKIQITGHIASGKSCLAHLIGSLLKSRGHTATICDDSPQIEPSIPWAQQFKDPRAIEIVVLKPEYSSELAQLLNDIADADHCCTCDDANKSDTHGPDCLQGRAAALL